MSDVVNFLQRIVMNMQKKTRPNTETLYPSTFNQFFCCHAPSQEITLDVQKVALMNQLVHLKPRIFNV
jgi:hypothetical protein